MNTPKDILNYVLENKLDLDFMAAIARHVGNYSIGEIADRSFKQTANGNYHIVAPSYGLDLKIEDDDVYTALCNGLYVSAFVSRKENSYNLHFLVHKYPESMKSQFEEEILKDCVNYMILNTIVSLKLDTEKKVDDYIKPSCSTT